MPGVVAHDVEPAEALDREVDHGLDLVGVGDVGLLERGRRAELRRQRLAAVAVDVGDDDLRAFLDEQLDDAAAQPAGATGDDRDLPRELGWLMLVTLSSIQKSGVVSTPWRAKIASISARSASLIDQPTAPTLSSTSATVRQPTSAVLTAGCEIAQRSASCGEALVVARRDALQLVRPRGRCP